MPLTSITLPGRQSRAHELHSALYDAILSGELTSGDRLIEEQIATMASVSRTPVREAIRRLEAEGLVENSASGPVATTLRSDALVEMCEVREVLGAHASRLTALGRSEMTILTLEDIINRLRDLNDGNDVTAELLRTNNAFHETVWDASGNRYLADQLRVLRARISLSGPNTLTETERRPQSLAEHEALLEAIRDRDGDRAAELTSLSFRRAMAIRLARLRSEAVVRS